MRFTYNEAIIYGAIAGGIIGLVFGLVLLFLGFKKDKRKLGIMGFAVTFVVGPASGLLSLISACVFLWLILRKTPQNLDENAKSETEKNPDNDIS